MTPNLEEYYATVDLGSNSFHMIVAKFSEGRLQVVDRIKDMVRLASGLDDNQELSEESTQRALKCLEQFGQRLREIPNINIRAVGTNTLRQAKNNRMFLSLAQTALGHSVEILAGREEARLIYLGVAHTQYDEINKRLIIDIGGSSTELIIGCGFDAYYTESLYMGCVNLGQRFFANGRITAKRMRKAMVYARQELEPIESSYKKMGWDFVLGSSGTIISISNVVQAQGWCKTGITASALATLKNELIAIGDINIVSFDGLSERRKPVFASGVAVLSSIFEAFELDKIGVSEGALREGLLYELIGGDHNTVTKDKTVTDLSERYNVDKEQAKRIKETAEMIFLQIQADWSLDKKKDLKLLQWGALIHEIGLSIAHTQYHRHGAYLITHSDLPGFSQQDQMILAMLVRAHRRKFPLQELELVTSIKKASILKVCILLRLSVVMHRSRSNGTLPKIQVDTTNKDNIDLMFPQGWLDAHPLTQADLITEKNYLQVTDIKLTFH